MGRTEPPQVLKQGITNYEVVDQALLERAEGQGHHQ